MWNRFVLYIFFDNFEIKPSWDHWNPDIPYQKLSAAVVPCRVIPTGAVAPFCWIQTSPTQRCVVHSNVSLGLEIYRYLSVISLKNGKSVSFSRVSISVQKLNFEEGFGNEYASDTEGTIINKKEILKNIDKFYNALNSERGKVTEQRAGFRGHSWCGRGRNRHIHKEDNGQARNERIQVKDCKLTADIQVSSLLAVSFMLHFHYAH